MKKNRYAKKRKHKRELEKRYATLYGEYNVKKLRDRMIKEAENDDSWWSRKHPPRNRGWEYWHSFYRSGSRHFAKQYTDRRIRQKYRRMIRNRDHEDIHALKGADYEKEFDFAYTID